MGATTKSSWGWCALLGVLAATNVAQLFVGAEHVVGSVLMAVGFAALALGALYRPGGFVTVSWQQLKAPRKLGSAKAIGVVAIALLVVGTVLQWFKI